jgi:DNA-binding HxlR family transcriptional regulator
MDDALRLRTCSIGRAMDILGERWTLLILRECFYGVRRFSVMQRNLGIARNILAARLRLLVRTGILERRRYQEEPERFEYRLTEKGLALYPAVVAIMRWGDEFLAHEGPPVVLRHSCGHAAPPLLVCGHCGEELDPHDVTPEPADAPALST